MLRPNTQPETTVPASANFGLGMKTVGNHRMSIAQNDGEERGEPIRPPAFAQLNVNSIDRYSNKNQTVGEFAQILQPWVAPPLPNAPAVQQLINFTNNAGLPPPANNFTFSQTRAMINGYFTRLAVKELMLDWSVPNIIQNVNDQVKLAIPGLSTLNVTLAPGFYDGVQLANNLETRCQAALSTAGFPEFASLEVAYNPQFQNFNAQLFDGTVSTTGFAFATEPFANNDERKRVLKTYKTLGVGWPNTQSTLYYGTDPVTFSTLSSINTAQILGEKYRSPYTDYIDIISDKLSQYMKVRDGETTQIPETDILCRVFLTPPNSASVPDASGNQLGTRPFKMTWDPNTTKFFRWTPNEAIYDFDIQVKDMYGDLVPWSGKWPFEFHMNMLASET